MRRWLVVCAVLCAALASGIGAARMLGSRQAPTFHMWLRHANGAHCQQACLLGVSPNGALSFQAARAIFAAHPLLQGAAFVDRGLTLHWRTPDFDLSIGRTRDSEQLAWINAQIRRHAPRVSDLIAAYGVPDYVAASYNSILTDLLYAAHGLQASSLREALPESAPLRLSHRIYNLYLLEGEQFEALLREIGGSLKAWRGLVPITHYLNRPSRIAIP